MTIKREERYFDLRPPLWLFQKRIFYKDSEALFFLIFNIIRTRIFHKNFIETP